MTSSKAKKDSKKKSNEDEFEMNKEFISRDSKAPSNSSRTKRKRMSSSSNRLRLNTANQNQQ